VDLTSFIRSEPDVEEAKALIVRERFCYQPFRFSPELEVGGGYEFLNRRPGAGMIHWPAYEAERQRFPGPPVKTIDPAELPAFRTANDALRKIYDGFVDQICEQVTDIAARTVADVGCNNGYMPVSFALRGARAFGYDQNDASGTFAFLNRLLGADARFVHLRYEPVEGAIPGCSAHDVVISMSVLQHMTEPLRHLHFLRSITRRALFLMTNTWDDDEYLMRYGEPNATSELEFPWSFDNSIYLSEKLLRRALAAAGFTRVVDLEFRAPPGTQQAEARGSHDYASDGAHPRRLEGKALLCFVDGPARGAQASLEVASARLSSNRLLARLRKRFPGLAWWAMRKVMRRYR
jgi:Protein of unknown function (DUF1698)